MLEVYTGTIRTADPDRQDITVKSGNLAFAPTWPLVIGYKKGDINEEKYISLYTELMRRSYQKHRVEWEKLLQKKRVVLCCYCPAGEFCHRVLLAGMLAQFPGVEYKGEIPAKTPKNNLPSLW